jgi:hypothetical protein
MSAQAKQERRRMQLLASKATFQSDPAKQAAEIDKKKKERKEDSEKALQRRQVDSERKRQRTQRRECFSIWCAACNQFFSSSFLSEHFCTLSPVEAY